MLIMTRITKADLEKEIIELKEKNKKLLNILDEDNQKYSELMERKTFEFHTLPEYQSMKKNIVQLEEIKKANETTIERQKKMESTLRNKIQELLAENKQLKESIKNQAVINDTKHNARGAGRKPKPTEKIHEQLQCLDELLNDGKKEKEICKLMKISHATYYRLKKVWKLQYH